ncbi:MAG: hypothetical protein IT380_14100 [Myxococcales bacterium]|nr:hypothetical protein [Myxococcales bacterium]
MSTDGHDHHDKPASPPVRTGASLASLMPVTRLISRPSMEVRDGRLVAVLALLPSAA